MDELSAVAFGVLAFGSESELADLLPGEIAPVAGVAQKEAEAGDGGGEAEFGFAVSEVFVFIAHGELEEITLFTLGFFVAEFDGHHLA